MAQLRAGTPGPRLIPVLITVLVVLAVIAINLVLAFGFLPSKWSHSSLFADENGLPPSSASLRQNSSRPSHLYPPANASKNGIPALPPNVKLLYITGFNTRQRVFAQLSHLPVHNPDQIAIFSDVPDEFRYMPEGGSEMRVIQAIDAMEFVERAGKSFFKDEDREHHQLIKNAFAGRKNALGNPALKYHDRSWKLSRFKFPVVLFHAAEMAKGPNSPFDVFWFLDDDSHAFTTSLPMLLALYGPPNATDLYLGTKTASGYDSFMAHGGSSFVLSRAAVRKIDASHHHRCLSEASYLCCGDTAVSHCLGRVGVHLTPPPPGRDVHAWFENAQSMEPLVRHVATDRCGPVMALHLRGPPGWIDPSAVARMERRLGRGVVRSDVVEAVLAPDLSGRGGSRVGRPEPVGDRGPDAMRADRVDSAHDADTCEAACQRDESCLAWEWKPSGVRGVAGACWNAPWFLRGKDEEVVLEAAQGVVSKAMMDRYLMGIHCGPPA